MIGGITSSVRVTLADRPPPPSLSDAQWDDIESRDQIEMFRSKRSRSNPASPAQTQRWPILSDTERDDRDSEKQIATLERVAREYQERRWREMDQHAAHSRG